jgi:hypothetical protein
MNIVGPIGDTSDENYCSTKSKADPVRPYAIQTALKHFLEETVFSQDSVIYEFKISKTGTIEQFQQITAKAAVNVRLQA